MSEGDQGSRDLSRCEGRGEVCAEGEGERRAWGSGGGQGWPQREGSSWDSVQGPVLEGRAETGASPGDILTFHHQVQVVAVLRPSGGLIIDAAIKPSIGFTY